MFNPDMPLDEQIELLPYDPRYEFPKESIFLKYLLTFQRKIVDSIYIINGLK
jgi:hypothetical protein